MNMAANIAGALTDRGRRAMSESGWFAGQFLFAGPTELAVAFSRRNLLDEGGFTPLGSAVRDIIGRGKGGLADRRDRDASLAEDAKRLSGEAVAARPEGIAQ